MQERSRREVAYLLVWGQTTNRIRISNKVEDFSAAWDRLRNNPNSSSSRRGVCSVVWGAPNRINRISSSKPVVYLEVLANSKTNRNSRVGCLVKVRIISNKDSAVVYLIIRRSKGVFLEIRNSNSLWASRNNLNWVPPYYGPTL